MAFGVATVILGLAATTVMLLTEPEGAVTWVVPLSLWAVLGAGTSMINTPLARLLHDQATADNRTAIFSAQFSFSHARFILTYPIAGRFAHATSQFAGAAMLTALATLALSTAHRASGEPKSNEDSTVTASFMVCARWETIISVVAPSHRNRLVSILFDRKQASRIL